MFEWITAECLELYITTAYERNQIHANRFKCFEVNTEGEDHPVSQKSTEGEQMLIGHSRASDGQTRNVQFKLEDLENFSCKKIKGLWKQE